MPSWSYGGLEWAFSGAGDSHDAPPSPVLWGQVERSTISIRSGPVTLWVRVVVDGQGVIPTDLEQVAFRADRQGGAQQQVDGVLGPDDEHQGHEHRQRIQPELRIHQ